MNSISRGTIAELITASKLSEFGFQISFPISHSSEYDMICDVGNELIKIQVKRAFKIKNKGIDYLGVGCKRQMTSRGVNKIRTQKYSNIGYDFLIICDVDNRDYWVISRNDVGNKSQIYVTSKNYLKYKNNFSILHRTAPQPAK